MKNHNRSRPEESRHIKEEDLANEELYINVRIVQKLPCRCRYKKSRIEEQDEVGI